MVLVDCNSAQNSPMVVLDGIKTTIWEGAWASNPYKEDTKTPPYWAIFQFPDTVDLVGVGITRRQDGYTKDLVTGYVEYSMDGEEWEKGIEFDFGGSDSKETVWFETINKTVIQTEFIKFVMTSGARGNSVGFVELDFRVKE